ncbi:MAG: hypothetical protein A2070_12815 [Bdellovibrionales bacterium GWC1_52_8]|nr:MAG: hypothetical protein A2Z97_01580 [Bdellovibrionales bacterium GWB1_52_6]OFZ05030.1 MAG: hypothetical protein A2X97_00340 [Bdellovibrionales bacterium GWA1_52_35]OFZ43261.1 MAG: hypothetical protein A2070_12815 [Bdellovibrionales bacterium GWC1_52_8]
MLPKLVGIVVTVFLASATAAPAGAAERAQKSAPATPLATPEVQVPSFAGKVNVDSIKEKYWAQGNETELGVVQNRAYSKARKFELGFLGGITSSDPFLNVTQTGGSLGFHFSEYFALHLFGWKSFTRNSSALNTFEEKMGATTNYNAPRWYWGAEGSASLIYGKLSFVGKAIMYYDMHVLAGAGTTATESGKYTTPHFGVGQQVYMNKALSIRLDYRMMGYREMIVEKVVPTSLGKNIGQRTNWTHAVTIGFDILIDAFGSSEK